MDTDKIINYKLLSEFIDFYKSIGFKEINVPWFVDEEYIKVTYPKFTDTIPLKDGFLVGSAEQSFMQLQHKNQLPDGFYMATTPCFRIEDGGRSVYHDDYFVKLELYVNKYLDFMETHQLIGTIFNKYNEYGDVRLFDTNDELSEFSLDIETVTGIELGSYGKREYNGKSWFYGTGLALPRFTQALKI